ncbi:MAG: hypothetical protein LBS89_02190 [Zoogloeaceae bacterium]|jgi:hypothetical protein|nr:hypothetical protein [Zoogloeaceae bacterium]
MMCSRKTNEAAPARHPQAWEEIFREAVHLNANTPIADDHGLPQVLARIAQAPPPSSRTRIATRIVTFGCLVASSLCRHWQTGLALACTLIVVQGAVIAYLWQATSSFTQPDHDGYAVMRVLPSHTVHQTFIRVAFLPETSEQVLRSLLNEIQADVVAGPTQLGDYYLCVPPCQVDAAVLTLVKSSVIEDVALVDHLPGDH